MCGDPPFFAGDFSKTFALLDTYLGGPVTVGLAPPLFGALSFAFAFNFFTSLLIFMTFCLSHHKGSASTTHKTWLLRRGF